jgi:hypothetical protein
MDSVAGGTKLAAKIRLPLKVYDYTLLIADWRLQI